MAADPQNSLFIKNLASSDKKTRDTALSSLRTYLSARSSIPSLDLLKLWKGLFYCLWMQDKPVLQQRLARDLADLVSILKPDVVLPFLEAFWNTMAREWGGIESLRMDKFLYLVRQYMNASWKYLSKNDWGNEDAIQEYGRILKETPMNASDMKIPNGLRYHVLDIYVDELEKVGGEDLKGKEEVLEQLLEPVKTLMKESQVKSVRKAAKETLGDERLKVWRGEKMAEAEDEEMGDGEEDEWGGIED